MTDQPLQIPDPLVLSDGVAAYQRVLSLRKQYLTLLAASDEPPAAEERRLLLGYVERLRDSLETADLFAQLSQELIERLRDSELSQPLQERLESIPDAVKSELSGRDPLSAGIEGLAVVRKTLADERDRLPKERASLESGKRPTRGSGPENVSDDALFGGGIGLLCTGAAIATAIALAPKAAVAAVVVGGVTAGAATAVAAGAAIGFGAAMVADAVGVF